MNPISVNLGSGEPSIPAGCLVLFVSIFTMPIKTARVAAHELRSIAKAGALNTDNDFPHLSWYKAVLPVIATVLSIFVFLGYTAFGMMEGGAAGLIIGAVSGYLAAVMVDWLIMIFGEFLLIKVASGQYYTRRNRELDTHDDKAEQAAKEDATPASKN